MQVALRQSLTSFEHCDLKETTFLVRCYISVHNLIMLSALTFSMISLKTTQQMLNMIESNKMKY
jgi:hypothetical protein